MKTLWIAKELCKDIAEIIYDDILPITLHSIISRRKYKEIGNHHQKIIDFHNSLFDTNFSMPKMEFGRKWRYKTKKDIVCVGLAKRLDKALYFLSHEEGHRFYDEVNPFIDDKKDGEDNNIELALASGTINEGVAFYSSGKFMAEIGFEKISKGLEVWAYIHGSSSYILNPLPDPVDITKFLYSKGEEFFKEFVRLDTLEAIKILNPELEIEKCYGYAILYPTIEELVSCASKYSFLYEKDGNQPIATKLLN